MGRPTVRNRKTGSDEKKLRLVLTGGGTGGHVYPALAIHDMLDRADMVEDILFLGTRGRAEERIVPKRGLNIRYIASAPFAGGSLPAKVRTLLTIARGTIQAAFQLIRFKPDTVIATGGYVSAPVVLASYLLRPFLGLDIVAEEQNVVPGILNKVASLLADVVLVSFRETSYFLWSNRCVFSGYPVRPEYLETPADRKKLKQELGLPEDCFLILVTGGSLGARSINHAIAATLDRMAGEIPDLQIIHAVGMMETPEYNSWEDTKNRLRETLGSRFDQEKATAVTTDGREFYRGYRYLHDFIRYQQAADMIMTRAGAGALSEVMALGRAAVVIPKRGLPGDHQELNAVGLAEEGAIDVVFERRDMKSGIDFVEPDLLLKVVCELAQDPERRRTLEEKAHSTFFRRGEPVVIDSVRALRSGDAPDFMTNVIEPPFVRFQRQFDSLVVYLDRRRTPGLYHRLYAMKLEEYLASPHFLVVNKGIKLIGALRLTEKYPFLYGNFDHFEGFLKRNTLIALRKADSFHPEFVDMIKKGLEDGYYETRREAISLFNRFFREVLSDGRTDELTSQIAQWHGKHFESFEVRAASIRACVRILPEEEFFRAMRRYRFARNVRLREALLDAVEFGLSAGLLTRKDLVGPFLKSILITTSQFAAHFKVRERFVRVIASLEKIQ